MNQGSNDNYSSWSVSIKDFPENGEVADQICYILQFGLLAPSGHNGQPWNFKLNGNSVDIFVVKDRALPHSDPTYRQLSIGIGCLVNNIKIAADYFGFLPSITYFSSNATNLPVAKISLTKVGPVKNDQTHLINFITKRINNRGPYNSAPLPKEFISEVMAIIPEGLNIYFSSSPQDLKQMSEILLNSQIEIMEDKEFRQELSHLIKPNNTKSMVGMPGFAFGLPLVISLVSHLMIRYLNMSKINEKADKKLYSTDTHGFMTITAKEDTRHFWFMAGEFLETVWLIATKFGISLSVNAAPIQHQKSRQALSGMLNTNSFPVVFSRIGFSQTHPNHVPRLTLKQALIS